ncbi:hypothetical protein BDZ90DRAFT_21470 [Jaminaea rosea]|uniref:Uncharacterized protein n=1 Tax=Jaminaea rosea TaxID=1569628 RepID=A0A316V5M4_9BASI|nr:hypothetical protein BDZ90DRAFT_21470 [Jaminaea rosea]PWN30715.1 hypothetical protein BDZ90DRAFT_21470 [Jaminaea rosea]
MRRTGGRCTRAGALRGCVAARSPWALCGTDGTRDERDEGEARTKIVKDDKKVNKKGGRGRRRLAHGSLRYSCTLKQATGQTTLQWKWEVDLRSVRFDRPGSSRGSSKRQGASRCCDVLDRMAAWLVGTKDRTRASQRDEVGGAKGREINTR